MGIFLNGRFRQVAVDVNFSQLKKEQKNYNPAIRSIAPTRIPNMDVDAENIPIMIYPAMTPISNGI